MVGHFFNLLTQAFLSMPERIGSNWGGVIFSVALFLLAEILALVSIGVAVAEWKKHWVRNVVTGLVVVAVGWGGLFVISLIATTYDDHQNLVGAAGRFKRAISVERQSHSFALTSIKTAFGDQMHSLQTDCAVKDGINRALEQQNRDEQVLIAGC